MLCYRMSVLWHAMILRIVYSVCIDTYRTKYMIATLPSLVVL